MLMAEETGLDWVGQIASVSLDTLPILLLVDMFSDVKLLLTRVEDAPLFNYELTATSLYTYTKRSSPYPPHLLTP
jgi:hypothetical protein